MCIILVMMVGVVVDLKGMVFMCLCYSLEWIVLGVVVCCVGQQCGDWYLEYVGDVDQIYDCEVCLFFEEVGEGVGSDV